MTRVTNADHVLLLLRAQLERTQKQRRKRKTETSGQDAAPASALQRVERLVSSDGFSERDLKKALISALLTDEFGADVLNDPSFVQIVDDVLAIIERDQEVNALLNRAFEHVASRNGGASDR